MLQAERILRAAPPGTRYAAICTAGDERGAEMSEMSTGPDDVRPEGEGPEDVRPEEEDVRPETEAEDVRPE